MHQKVIIFFFPTAFRASGLFDTNELISLVTTVDKLSLRMCFVAGIIQPSHFPLMIIITFSKCKLPHTRDARFQPPTLMIYGIQYTDEPGMRLELHVAKLRAWHKVREILS